MIFGRKGRAGIKVKLKGLRILLESKKWRKIRNRPGFESTEFEFKCRGWKKARFVAVREIILSDLKDKRFDKGPRRLLLLREQHGTFAYGFPQVLWTTSTSENWIEWCMGSILTRTFGLTWNFPNLHYGLQSHGLDDVAER